MANGDVMSTQDTLLAYSEWLDSQHLIASDTEGYSQPVREHPDGRSHDQLAKDFIAHWEANEDRAILAGRVGAALGKAFETFVTDVRAALDKQS